MGECIYIEKSIFITITTSTQNIYEIQMNVRKKNIELYSKSKIL